MPDLLYISHARSGEIVTEKHVTGAPEIVVEIGSKSTRRRDETIKRHLYERRGVSEYWVIDPERDAIRIYTLNGDQFGRPTELSREAGDVLRTPHLEGLEVPLERVFQD